MALVCSARSKIWSAICVLSVGLALILMIGGALGWFEANGRGREGTQRRKNFVVDAGIGPNYPPEDTDGDGTKNFSSGESSGDSDLNELNDWNDVTYDYPESDDDYEDSELGSSAPVPPIPPPPPSPAGGDFTALKNLATSFKGTKGDKGEMGPRGPPGPNGQKGEPGKVVPIPREPGSGAGEEFIPFDPGSYSYPPAKCTCNYTELFTKLPDSFRGTDGKAGPPGPAGLVGPQGEMGIQGKKGEIGYQGPKGEQGVTGEKGERGLPGLSMTPNAVGFDPDWRPRNLMKEHLAKPGPPGVKGDVGDVGPKGSQGDKGERGFQGLAGEKGDKGTAGVGGLPGPPGKDGTKGELGPPGPMSIPTNLQEMPLKEPVKGDKGDIGLPGKRGRRGKVGPPGPPGEVGIPGWPTGTMPLGRPGTSITGPKGEKGDPLGIGDGFYKYEIQGPPAPAQQCQTTCPPGPRGPPGPPGVPGISIVGEPGIGIPGPPGQKGESGPTSSSSSSKVVPGAVVFLTREAMIRMSDLSALGTIAFVKDEELLFVRVSGGWRPIITGELLLAPSMVMGHSETTSEPARLMRHPFEASSLVNSVIEGPSLRLAALNDPWSGDMHGIRGSDYSCYRQARNANLVGTFRAFLVSYVQNLDSIVKYSDRNLPVLNTKGELLFNSWSEIFQGNGAFLSSPPTIYSFSGRNVIKDFHWPQKMIWHGSASGGLRAKTAYCEAWHSDSPSNVGLASDLLKGQILGQENVGCNSKLVVLCIEIASHSHYNRRRRRSPSLFSASPNSVNFSMLNDVNALRNLTLEEYSQFIEEYDKELEAFVANEEERESKPDEEDEELSLSDFGEK